MSLVIGVSSREDNTINPGVANMLNLYRLRLTKQMLTPANLQAMMEVA